MLLLLRGIFLAVLCLTLMLLLLSATQILAAKIWLASWLPGARWLDEAELTAHADQWIHALLFTTLGGLAMAAWRSRSERQRLGWGLLGLAIATEILQAWVPGRSPVWPMPVLMRWDWWPEAGWAGGPSAAAKT